jgi:tRNA(Arg) A34 adenosine deaminase TadA
MTEHETLMRRAVAVVRERMGAGSGGPFGAVIVRDGQVIAEGFNQVTSTNDPTAHAEMVAIRAACRALGTYHLSGCAIYASCEPCPMCLSAIYWAQLGRIYYASTRHDAARIGFADAAIYEELAKPPAARSIAMTHVPITEAEALLEAWRDMPGRVLY